MEFSHDMLDRLEKLEAKFAAMGQDMQSYLDGLLYADYLTYWDYIHLDTLLSLQTPKTPIPDERIFIMYHQITELYFRLILDAVARVTLQEGRDAALLKRQLQRCISYFEMLISSYEVMVEGMDPDEFRRFRMSLLPASGFQSAQYRKIEIVSTDLHRLVHTDKRDSLKDKNDLKKAYQFIYWRSGATELATGKKTLTLRQFEEKYGRELLTTAETYKNCNLWQYYQQLSEADRADKELITLLRKFDLAVNVRWPLMHYKSAVRYLDNKPHVIAATGGTNWQKYLPPRYQRVMFYPELWSEQERENWGKFTEA